MSSVHENTIYSLKENVTGREDDGCRFRYVLSGEAISFFFDVEDEDIVSPYRKDNENIFLGDAVEVFLSPDGDLTRYKELEVSPFGVRFYGNIRNESGSFPELEKIPPAFSADVRMREGGWRAEIVLPLAALEGFDGKTMKLNAFRLDKKADGRLLLYALNPTLCESFHRPAFFL